MEARDRSYLFLVFFFFARGSGARISSFSLPETLSSSPVGVLLRDRLVCSLICGDKSGGFNKS